MVDELNKAIETIKMLQDQNQEYAQRFRENDEPNDHFANRENLIQNVDRLVKRVDSYSSMNSLVK